MTPNEFREIVLACSGATESEHMNHPDFRLNGKIFASLGYPDEQWGMVKLTPEQQHYFMAKAPQMFKPCNGAWGRQGCTNVNLKAAQKNILRAAIDAAFSNLISSAAAKSISRSSEKRRTRVSRSRNGGN